MWNENNGGTDREDTGTSPVPGELGNDQEDHRVMVYDSFDDMAAGHKTEVIVED